MLMVDFQLPIADLHPTSRVLCGASQRSLRFEIPTSLASRAKALNRIKVRKGVRSSRRKGAQIGDLLTPQYRSTFFQSTIANRQLTISPWFTARITVRPISFAQSVFSPISF